MYNTFFHRLFLIIKIWLIAIRANSVLLALFLAVAVSNLGELIDYLGFGIVVAGLFSFPIMLALMFTLSYCIRSGMTGKRLFRAMVVVSMVLTVIMVLIVSAMAEIGGLFEALLTGFGVLSGMVAIFSQYRRLLQYGCDYEQNNSSYEN